MNNIPLSNKEEEILIDIVLGPKKTSQCPKCGKNINTLKLISHLKKSHKIDIENNALLNQKIIKLIRYINIGKAQGLCIKCKAPKPLNKLIEHISTLHEIDIPSNMKRTFLLASLGLMKATKGYILYPQHIDSIEVVKKYLLQKSNSTRKNQYQKSDSIGKNQDVKSIAIGEKVLQGVMRGNNWLAKSRSIERCDDCRKRIIHLEMDSGKLKAFDVEQSRVISGVHICSGKKGESIYAWQGGIIDSNRKKH